MRFACIAGWEPLHIFTQHLYARVPHAEKNQVNQSKFLHLSLNFIRKLGMNRLAAVLDSRVLLLGPSGLVFSRRAEFKCFGGSSSGQGPPATGAWGAI